MITKSIGNLSRMYPVFAPMTAKTRQEEVAIKNQWVDGWMDFGFLVTSSTLVILTSGHVY